MDVLHELGQEVVGRKSRDIMHSFAVPPVAGPISSGFLEAVPTQFRCSSLNFEYIL
jgi:hypothetical protein